MEPIIKITDDKFAHIKIIADARFLIHYGQPGRRALIENYELFGLLGEYAFYKTTGIVPDWSLKKYGDSRIDFYTKLGTVDVKTITKPYYGLLREVDKEHADILVLAYAHPDLRTVSLFGWEYDSRVIEYPIVNLKRGIINHLVPKEKLRDMQEIIKLLGD